MSQLRKPPSKQQKKKGKQVTRNIKIQQSVKTDEARLRQKYSPISKIRQSQNPWLNNLLQVKITIQESFQNYRKKTGYSKLSS